MWGLMAGRVCDASESARACSSSGKHISAEQLSACASASRDSPHWYQPKEPEKSPAVLGSCSFSGGILTQSKEGAALCYQPPSICLGHVQEAFPDQSLVSHEETLKLLLKRALSISTAAIRATTLPQAQPYSNLLIAIIFLLLLQILNAT